MKLFNWSVLIVLSLLVGLTSNALAVMPTTPVVCDQAKVEMLAGHIVAGDSFHYILKVGANSSTDASSSTASSCSVGSMNTTGELVTNAATGYTQHGVTQTGCTWTLASHSVNFTCGASTWTAVSAAATFDTVEVYDATCTGCSNANQLVAIFPITSFTGPTAGTYTVNPPANMFVLTRNDFDPKGPMDMVARGAENMIVAENVAVSGSGIVNLPSIHMTNTAH